MCAHYPESYRIEYNPAEKLIFQHKNLKNAAVYISGSARESQQNPIYSCYVFHWLGKHACTQHRHCHWRIHYSNLTAIGYYSFQTFNKYFFINQRFLQNVYFINTRCSLLHNPACPMIPSSVGFSYKQSCIWLNRWLQLQIWKYKKKLPYAPKIDTHYLFEMECNTRNWRKTFSPKLHIGPCII